MSASDLRNSAAARIDARAALARVASSTRAIAEAADLDELLATLLDAIAALGGETALVLFVDESGERLYTVASRGYEDRGVGSEVGFGEGAIGVAARDRRPMRIQTLGNALNYARAARRRTALAGEAVGREIGLPGLPDAQSQLAVPLLAGGELVGVVCAEHTTVSAFDSVVEDAVVALAASAATRFLALRAVDDGQAVEAPASPPRVDGARTHVVEHYEEDDSVFVDHQYIIKSLPGRILWRLLQEHATAGRTEFTNIELRRDTWLKLPAIKDNLESRLLLLRSRLEDKGCPFRIEKRSRGRFALVVDAALELRTRPAS